MPESELFQYWISKFSSRIGLAISFPLTSKPFTIMHKSSITDFKKCFKEKKIVVYSRKRIRLKHARWGKYQERWKWEQNIQTNEHMGSLIKLISWWFSQWALGKRFEFFEISSWLQLCPSRNRHSSVETLHWFIFLHESLFQVFSSCFSFLGMPFLFFFLLFQLMLLFYSLFKMNEIFYFSKEEKLFSSSTCIWSKWTFKVRNVGQVQVYTRRG